MTDKNPEVPSPDDVVNKPTLDDFLGGDLEELRSDIVESIKKLNKHGDEKQAQYKLIACKDFKWELDRILNIVKSDEVKPLTNDQKEKLAAELKLRRDDLEMHLQRLVEPALHDVPEQERDAKRKELVEEKRNELFAIPDENAPIEKKDVYIQLRDWLDKRELLLSEQPANPDQARYKTEDEVNKFINGIIDKTTNEDFASTVTELTKLSNYLHDKDTTRMKLDLQGDHLNDLCEIKKELLKSRVIGIGLSDAKANSLLAKFGFMGVVADDNINPVEILNLKIDIINNKARITDADSQYLLDVQQEIDRLKIQPAEENTPPPIKAAQLQQDQKFSYEEASNITLASASLPLKSIGRSAVSFTQSA